MNVIRAKEYYIANQRMKGHSETHIKQVEKKLMYLFTKVGLDKDVNDITLADVKEYQLELSTRSKRANGLYEPIVEQRLSKATIKSYMCDIKAFFNEMYIEELIERDIAKKIKMPKLPKKIINILSEPEIRKVLEYYPETCESNVRNKLIMCFMLDSGLRISDVVNLNLDSIDLDRNIIMIKMGKGAKDRVVPIGLFTKRVLIQYMYKYRRLVFGDHLLLRADGERITINAIGKVFSRCKRGTKISRMHPHLLRHTFATRFLMNGGGEFGLQMILGHTSLKMVHHYSHMAQSYLIAQHQEYAPLDNIMRK